MQPGRTKRPRRKVVPSSDSGAPEDACAESVSDVDDTRRSGVVTDFLVYHPDHRVQFHLHVCNLGGQNGHAVKLSPVLIPEPQKTLVLKVSLMSTIHVEATSQIFSVYHPDHRVQFHLHVCNLVGQNGHAVKLSPVLIPEPQKTLVLKVSLLSTIHVEAGSSLFLVCHPDHRIQLHLHVCNLGGQNGHAVKLSPVLIPEPQKTLVLKVSLMSTIHIEAGSSQIFLVYHPDHRVQFHLHVCNLGGQNGHAVKLSPVLIPEPQKTLVLKVSLLSTIHVEAGSSHIFLMYHPDHRVQLHLHVCNLGGQNGHAVKLSPVLIPEPQKTLCAESVSDVDDTRRSGVVTDFFGVPSRSQGSAPSARVQPGRTKRPRRKIVPSSDSGALEDACAESVSDVDDTRRSGVVTEFFGVPSRSATLQPGKSKRLHRKIVLSFEFGASEDACDVNVSDVEDARGRGQRVPTTKRRLSRTQEAAVPPETTGWRSMTSEPAPTAFMTSSCTPQLEAHVNALLSAYTTGGSTACRAQLAELPEFPADDSLSNLPREFEDAVRMLIYDRVNSDAALQVRQDLADTMLYPLAVLLHASAAAEGLPVVFFIDLFHTILNSVLHKSSHVKMGRWESKAVFGGWAPRMLEKGSPQE